MESPYGRKLIGQPVAVFVSEQFEPADTGVCPTDKSLLGPRLVLPEDDPDDAPKGRPRRITREGGSLRAVDGWIDGVVTGWHDSRGHTVVTLGNQPNAVMQGPAEKDHAWLGISLWHNLDVQLYSLDPGAEVDHWRAYKLVDHTRCLVVRNLRRLGYVGLPHVACGVWCSPRGPA